MFLYTLFKSCSRNHYFFAIFSQLLKIKFLFWISWWLNCMLKIVINCYLISYRINYSSSVPLLPSLFLSSIHYHPGVFYFDYRIVHSHGILNSSETDAFIHFSTVLKYVLLIMGLRFLKNHRRRGSRFPRKNGG